MKNISPITIDNGKLRINGKLAGLSQMKQIPLRPFKSLLLWALTEGTESMSCIALHRYKNHLTDEISNSEITINEVNSDDIGIIYDRDGVPEQAFFPENYLESIHCIPECNAILKDRKLISDINIILNIIIAYDGYTGRIFSPVGSADNSIHHLFLSSGVDLEDYGIIYETCMMDDVDGDNKLNDQSLYLACIEEYGESLPFLKKFSPEKSYEEWVDCKGSRMMDSDEFNEKFGRGWSFDKEHAVAELKAKWLNEGWDSKPFPVCDGVIWNPATISAKLTDSQRQILNMRAEKELSDAQAVARILARAEYVFERRVAAYEEFYQKLSDCPLIIL